MKRRDFIKLSSSAVGAVALGACTQKATDADILWKYAMCNESMADKPWAEQCKIIADAGYTGVEIAAFTLVNNGVQDLSPNDRQEMVSVMRDNGLQCAGLHWLLAPPPEGLHFTTPDAKVRRRTVDYLHALIDFCGDLGGEAMIFGSPKQRNTVQGATVEDAKKYFAEGLAAVAEHAEARQVKILIEHLDHSQTDVVNTLKEAVEIAEQVNSPAIDIMFDFHNTKDETEGFVTLLDRYYDHIHHIHVQEMDGDHLGTGNAAKAYVDAFQFLKDKKFRKWVSLEVFDFSPGGKVIAEESMRVLKEIESKLA